LDPGETVAAQRLSQILSPDAPPAFEKSRLSRRTGLRHSTNLAGGLFRR
jgi:hypothetical protein